MHNVMFDPPVAVPSGFLHLLRVWEVRGDASYRVNCPRGFPRDGWIVVRTLAGRGYVDVGASRPLECGPESLMLFNPARIRGYGSVEPLWSFWWFECGTGSTWLFPEETPMAVPLVPDEARRMETCARLLNDNTAAAGLASAMLLQLCHEWHVARVASVQAGRPGWPRIRDVMRHMQATAERPCTVKELARLARLSEGRFRRLFHDIAGCSPKAYCDNLRLAKSVAWLQEGRMKLAEIAERLHYSSAFHFSRTFKKRYGKPPSMYRPG